MKRFLFEYLPAWLLLLVFGFIVLHAPLTVWLGTVFPDMALAMKAWKEVLIGIAAVLVALQLHKRGALRGFLSRPVVWLALVYSVVHIMLLGVYPQSLQSMAAGLLIDLRYIIFFVTVYGFLTLYPIYRRSFVVIGALGACIVLGFAVLQVFLPKYALETLGYGDTTIAPYMTVDKNPDFIRHNSTLRGPNPLGAYAVMALAGVLAYTATTRKRAAGWRFWVPVMLFAASGAVALWISYSRSAWLGFAVAAVVLGGITYGKKVKQHGWKIVAGFMVLLAIGVYAFKDTVFFQNVVLHNNPTTGAAVDSNTQHADSLAEGFARMALQPLGAGIGSTGSASLLGGENLIIENQYLMIAHEAGWLGIGLFLLLFGALLHQLWIRRADWLAAAVFASGIGLAVIGVLLPVWADDTVSIVWWGLAATVLIGGVYGRDATNKKAKRTT